MKEPMKNENQNLPENLQTTPPESPNPRAGTETPDLEPMELPDLTEILEMPDLTSLSDLTGALEMSELTEQPEQTAESSAAEVKPERAKTESRAAKAKPKKERKQEKAKEKTREKKEPRHHHPRVSYGYLFKEGAKGIFRHAFMSFAAICVMVACLIIMGSFTLVALNVDMLITQAEQENEVTVFIDEALEDAEARSIGTEINKIDNVLKADFISKETAFEEYQHKMGQEQNLLEGIDQNPLRHRYGIYLKDISLMQETIDQLDKISGIVKINARIDIAQGFVNARAIINGVGLTLSVILLVISLFIISNTVKLATFDRREEIAIMKMVGATNGFIRIPFVIEGMFLGLLGAAAAFFLQWGIYEAVINMVTGVAGAAQMINFQNLMLPTIAVFLLIGLFVGVGGSVMTIRKYLKV